MNESAFPTAQPDREPLARAINLHVYPSTLTTASRIDRIARFLAGYDRFDFIELAGIAGTGLADLETTGKIRRRRFRRWSGPAPKSAIGKLLPHIGWNLRILRHYRDKPVAMINCHALTVLPLCCLLKLMTGARLVYDTHELETETIALGGLRKLISKITERMLIRFTDAIVVVSPAIADWYKAAYGRSDVTTVLNCPDTGLSDHSTAPVDLRKHFSIPADRRIYMYLGLIGPGRGVRLMLDSFGEQVANDCLVFVGDGELRSDVETFAHGHPNVHYLPPVPPTAVPAIAAQADIGLSLIEPVVTSYEYCLPNKLFEYISAGTPVAVSATREQKAVVEANGFGFVIDCSQAGALTDFRKNVTGDEIDGARNAALAARSRFNWQAQEAVMRDVYDGLVAAL